MKRQAEAVDKTDTKKKKNGRGRLSPLEDILSRVEKCLKHIKPDLERLMYEDPANWQRANVQDKFVVVIANGLAGCAARHLKPCGANHKNVYCKLMTKIVASEAETPEVTASERWISSVACSALASFRKCSSSLEHPFSEDGEQEHLCWSELPPEIFDFVLSHADEDTLRTLVMVNKAWNDSFSSLSLNGIALRFVRKFRKSHLVLNFNALLEVVRRCLSFGESVSTSAFTSFARNVDDSIISAVDCGEAWVLMHALRTELVSKRILQIQRGDNIYALCFTLTRYFGDHSHVWHGYNKYQIIPTRPTATIKFYKNDDNGPSPNSILGFSNTYKYQHCCFPTFHCQFNMTEYAEFLERPDFPMSFEDDADYAEKEKERMSISLSVLEKFVFAAYGKRDGQVFIKLCCDQAVGAGLAVTQDIDLCGLPSLKENERFVKKKWACGFRKWESCFARGPPGESPIFFL